MNFTSPETVLSPKDKVSDLRILVDTGEDGWSLADLRWEGTRRLGIRWNGNSSNRIGNPQSRGIPTWFLVPQDAEAPLRQRFDTAPGEIDPAGRGITRVRIRPLPDRIWEGKDQEKVDYEWVLSITDPEHGSFEIMNPSTGHFVRLTRQHVRKLIADTPRDLPNGPRHGILELGIRLVFEDRRVRLEPVHTLASRIDALFASLTETGYENRDKEIRSLIEEARVCLAQPDGQLGPWETEELAFAQTATENNRLKLALSAIRIAADVHELPPEEYKSGFNYSRRRAAA
jgi:hypothetical protein